MWYWRTNTISYKATRTWPHAGRLYIKAIQKSQLRRLTCILAPACHPGRHFAGFRHRCHNSAGHPEVMMLWGRPSWPQPLPIPTFRSPGSRSASYTAWTRKHAGMHWCASITTCPGTVSSARRCTMSPSMTATGWHSLAGRSAPSRSGCATAGSAGRPSSNSPACIWWPAMPAMSFWAGTVPATSYDQNQRVEKKRKLYIVPRAFLWKTPRLPSSFHLSILHTGSPSPAVTD